MKTRIFLSVAAAAAAVLLTPAVHAQFVPSEKLQIVEGRAGVDPDTGFVRITGELWNRSDKTLEQPEIIVELYDPSGKPIDVTGFLAEVKKEAGTDVRDGVLTERTYLAPGEAAVFEYMRDPKKLSGKKYGSHKLFAKARTAEGTAPKASVEGFKFSGDKDGFFAVSGTIRNTGSVPCRSPRAVLGFYSPDGKVVLASYEQPDEMFQKKLAPGQTVGFSRKSILTPSGSTIKDVKVWGDCALPD